MFWAALGATPARLSGYSREYTAYKAKILLSCPLQKLVKGNIWDERSREAMKTRERHVHLFCSEGSEKSSEGVRQGSEMLRFSFFKAWMIGGQEWKQGNWQ